MLQTQRREPRYLPLLFTLSVLSLSSVEHGLNAGNDTTSRTIDIMYLALHMKFKSTIQSRSQMTPLTLASRLAQNGCPSVHHSLKRLGKRRRQSQESHHLGVKVTVAANTDASGLARTGEINTDLPHKVQLAASEDTTDHASRCGSHRSLMHVLC